ncbi:efflux RND transporter periplasmic adaptor subunit [Haloferula sp. A504]|uniref:efflux RND transporter periplasmic adaptor subunit n=1 Tax=Haloferula sp. A504 TaxID=3373601 RepID=UPI0031C610AD|nr:efflux RND transporter periplasmic adaptor subunit [Verrucomicrobiaceae bacterium E54]
MEESEHEVVDETRRSGAIHAVLSFVIALGLLVLGVVAVILFVLTKPEAEKKAEVELVPTVVARPVSSGSHRVSIRTQGVVSSVREVSIAAEVGGRVVSIDAELIEGGVVKKDQVLVRIDPADYEAALARAEAGLADARLALAQEQALAEQAALDWKKLGRGEPGDLVLRKPQIVAAEARIGSAKAEVERARRDLERTTIKAPFAARVRKAHVEEGAVVAPGTPVAELFSASELEVRLPFPLEDFGYLEPEGSPEIVLTASIGGREQRWTAVLDRVEGEVERSTLSGFGIAKVMPEASGELPPVGLFVDAEVPGTMLEDVVELPRSAVRGAGEVWVVADGRLVKRRVTILRAERERLVVRGDFQEGDQLVLTRLAAPLVGMKVEVAPPNGDGSAEASTD